ncbi:CaiB/BaiF CoA transferase family protein [Alicycliphilus denitrificans]|uniref:CoA transferase n=1 Tax=Alicycliphilus denitrificans TaxID=179636 RepID=A0A3R7FF48_9BURK|nr:CoA transferase [Alicycliphilus denitrificans]RKJ96721.1 CoA transferase [Alicycliphilus denitrificans]
MSAPNPVQRPLDGVRVLAIENFIAGPFASMWLADAGAEVVKIEEPGKGDHSRSTSPVRPDEEGTPQSLSFLRSNRNKRSVTLNLKTEEGKRVFRQLAEKADIVLENLRPGVMDKLGLGYADLRELNPGLIYVAISGYGHGDVKPSPYTEYPAFDIVAQALSGLMYRPERSGDRPIYLGVSLGDIQAGIVAAQGALLALLQRGRTGKGQKVDVSLYDAALVINELPIAMYSVFKEKYPPGAHALTAPFGTYRTADGYIVIAVLGEHVWQRFCEAIGQPELAHDERFKDGLSRRNNQKAMDAHIEPWLLARTRAEAVQALLDHGVPASVVNDVDDLFTCPHIAARDMLVQIDDPLWGSVQIPGNPIKMSGAPDIPLAHPPRLGEHTDEVLAGWLGLAPADVAALRERKVV